MQNCLVWQQQQVKAFLSKWRLLLNSFEEFDLVHYLISKEICLHLNLGVNVYSRRINKFYRIESSPSKCYHSIDATILFFFGNLDWVNLSEWEERRFVHAMYFHCSVTFPRIMNIVVVESESFQRFVGTSIIVVTSASDSKPLLNSYMK